MRILIVNQSFHPDVVAVAQHAADLASELAAAGHDVTIVAARRAYADPAARFARREVWRGCHIRRIWGPGLGKRSPWRRILDALGLLAAFFAELLRLPRFDVTIAMTHPPLLSFIAALIVRFKGGSLISWVMDLNPDEAIAAGWLAEDSVASRCLGAALRFSLRESARVIVLDRFMRERIVNKRVPVNAVSVIPPWSHDDVLAYDPAGRERFRRDHGLEHKFVVMYSGNVSIVHPVSTLLTAAVRLRDRGDVVFCFVGGGNGLDTVRAFASQNALGNLICLPYQTMERLAGSLSAADLHVIAMGDAMVGIVHPCKIYNVLALGIPFLHIGPDNDHLSDIAAAVGAPGLAYHAHHGDVDTVTSAIADAVCALRAPATELHRVAARFSQSALIPEFIRVVESAGTVLSSAHRGEPASRPDQQFGD